VRRQAERLERDLARHPVTSPACSRASDTNGDTSRLRPTLRVWAWLSFSPTDCADRRSPRQDRRRRCRPSPGGRSDLPRRSAAATVADARAGPRRPGRGPGRRPDRRERRAPPCPPPLTTSHPRPPVRPGPCRSPSRQHSRRDRPRRSGRRTSRPLSPRPPRPGGRSRRRTSRRSSGHRRSRCRRG